MGDYAGPVTLDTRTGFVRSDRKAKTFTDAAQAMGLLDPALLVHKLAMVGSLPNQDTLVPLASAATHSRGCAGCGASGAALGGASLHAGLTMAGLAWIIRRRNELTGRRRSSSSRTSRRR